MTTSHHHQQHAILSYALHELHTLQLSPTLLGMDDLVEMFREQLFAGAVHLTMRRLSADNEWHFQVHTRRLQVVHEGRSDQADLDTCEIVRRTAWRQLAVARLDHLAAALDDI